MIGSLPLFLVVAFAMIVLACALVVWPLTRGDDHAPLAAGSVVALLPIAAFLLYLAFSNWPWHDTGAVAAAPPAEAGSMEEMVVRLEQRLASAPNDAEGWQMLGRSYVVMGRYRDAVSAYDRARELSGDEDIAALTGYAEALAMLNEGVIGEESARLFEQALALSPDDKKALWYGGLAAFERGRAGLARERWQRLLELDPPDAMARVLREQIALTEAVTGKPETASAPGGAAGLRVAVQLDAALADRAPIDAPVFILARPPGGGGPPLAVVRRSVADLPLELVLSDADAMIPGRTLSTYEQVEIVARVALGGQPTAQPGDLYGSQLSDGDSIVAIAIDSVF